MLRIIQYTITAVNFTEFDREPSGHVNLIGRVKSVIHSRTVEYIPDEIFTGVTLIRPLLIIPNSLTTYSLTVIPGEQVLIECIQTICCRILRHYKQCILQIPLESRFSLFSLWSSTEHRVTGLLHTGRPSIIGVPVGQRSTQRLRCFVRMCPFLLSGISPLQRKSHQSHHRLLPEEILPSQGPKLRPRQRHHYHYHRHQDCCQWGTSGRSPQWPSDLRRGSM